METKITWKKPNYNGEWHKNTDEEIDRMCLEGGNSGDIIIKRDNYGTTREFQIFRIEKIGKVTEGYESLSRKRLIEELEERDKAELESEGKE